MKIERTKNASKNIVAGIVLKIYQMLAPFLMRTVMFYVMGKEYLGLNSLFYSVLHILNLAELGVGSAMVFSMYKPIAEDDEETICALMRLYRLYYRIIGLVIGVVGFALTPVIPNLIEGDIPGGLNVYVLYWLNLGATVLTYWLFAYKNCLLSAHQRTDVASIVTIITTTVQYGIQLAVMLLTKDYYLYLIVALGSQALNNVVTAVAVSKIYPQYKPRGKLAKEERKAIDGKIRDLFTGKLGSVVMTSADSVVISAVLGLAILANYQNYYFILTSVLGIVEIILQSVMAGLGNSYITETKEKNYQDLKKFTFLFLWLTGICTCCFLGLYQPFIELWLNKKALLSDGVVVCFVIYFFVISYNRLLNLYKDAAGLWRKDRFRPLVKAFVNLTLNILLIKVWGLYGVLLSTVFAVAVVGMPWLFRNLFTYCFDRSLLKDYLKEVIVFVALTVASCGLTWLICLPIQGNLWLEIALRLPVCLIVPNVVYLLVLHRSRQYRPSVQFVDRLTKNKLNLEKKLFRNQ